MDIFDIEYLDSKNGEKTVIVNKYLLHSKYNPVLEAEKIVEREYTTHYVHILFGYGMGYIAELLKKKIKDNNKLLIIDPLKKNLQIPNEDVFDFEEFENLLKKKLLSMLEYNNREVKIICSPNYNKLFPNEYMEILKLVKDIQRDSQVEENTIRRFSEYWEENYTKNLLTAILDKSINTLEKKYSCPIVVASGGPSLSKQLPKLKEIRDKIILIASGSTINTLLKNNIEPDYVVSIDGDEENYFHFKDLVLENVDLIYSMSSNFEIQREYKGNRYPFLTYNDLNTRITIFKKLRIDLPLIAGGGSVATFALSIAKFITSGPIALIGQDLAYTNNETHAKNNKYYKEVDEEYFKKIAAFEVEGYYGDAVMTDYAFASMKDMFVQIQKKIKHEAPLYNCTEGGIKIPGYDQMPFNDFVDKFIDEQIVVRKLKFNNIANDDKMKLLVEMLLEENSVLNKLEMLCVEMISLVKSTANKFEFKKSTLKKMDNNDKKIKEYIQTIRMNRIFEPLVIDIFRYYKSKDGESKKESFERVYNQNLEMYSRLLKMVEKAKKYNLDTIETAKLKEV